MKRFIFPIIALIILVLSSGTLAESVEIGDTTLELLSNTDQCLIDCEAWLEWDVSGSLADVLVPSKPNSKFKFEFKKKNSLTNDLLEWGTEVWEEKSVSVDDFCIIKSSALFPIKDLNAEQSCQDMGCIEEGLNCDCPTEESEVCGSHLEKSWEKVSDDFFGFQAKKGKVYRIRVWGKKQPMLGDYGIDWIPTLFGTKIGHWAWWNDSWSNKRQLTLAHAVDLNAGIVVKIENLDVSAWGLISLDEIRIVDENTLSELSRHIVGTTASTDMNIYFVLANELLLTDSPFTNFYVYYKNPVAGHVDDSNYTGSFDTFEDNDFLRPTWSNTTNATIQGAVVKNGSYAVSQTTNAPWGIGDWSQDLNYDIEQEFAFWFRTTDTAGNGYGGYIDFKNDSASVFAWIIYLDQLAFVGEGAYQTVYTIPGGGDNNWYYLKGIYNHSTDLVDAYAYDADGSLLGSLTGKTPFNTNFPIMTVDLATGDGSSTMYADDMFYGGYVSIESVGAEEARENVLDVNIWKVDGYDDSQVAYPIFNYLIDGNLTIDFNVYNIDNNQGFVDINYSTSPSDGTGVPIVENLVLEIEVCPNQDFTLRSSCFYDWNISAIQDGNYYILINYDSNSRIAVKDNTAETLRIAVPKLTMRFLDENTGKPIQGLSVTVASTTHITPGTGIIDLDIEVFAPTIYTVIAWQDNNYGTRYFEFDINQNSNIDANLAMLRDVNGQVMEFVFFDSDQTTLMANKRIHFYYDGADANIAGIRTTDAGGATSLFMRLDRNYYFVAQRGDSTQIRYDRVNVIFKIPKDEDSLASITPFDVKQSGIGLIDYANQNASIELYLFSNAVRYYQFDTNGGHSYLTRKMEVKYIGNPSTATIQAYLPNVDNGVESVFFTKDTDLSTVPGIRIVVFKTIEGAGTVEVQSVITDDAGTATMSFIIDDLYSFDVYDEDDVFVFSFELRPNFTTYYINLGTASLVTTPTELEYIFVLGIPNERYIAFDSSGYDVNITVDVNNGTIATSWLTVSNDDGNVTFNTSCGSGCSFHLELSDLNDTMDLTVTVFVETASGLKYLNSWTFVPYDASGYNLVATLQSADFRTGFGCDADPNTPCFFLLMVAVFLMIATVLAVGRTITTDRSALGIVVVIEMSIFTYFTWIPVGFFILATLAVFAGLVLSRRDF